MTTSPTRSINDLSRIYLTQVSEGKDNPYSIKNKLKMAIKSVAEKERAKAGVTREEVENIDEKCWDGYEKKGMKTMFGKRYPNCVKKKAKKEDFSNWRDDLSDIVEVMHMTDDKAEKKIDDKKTVKNKVIINPKLSEAVKDMGGELLEVTELEDVEEGAGLYANIHAKRKRGGKMRSKGDKGARSAQDFANAARTAKEETEHVDEAKVDKGMIFGKSAARNERRFGKKGHFDPAGAGSRGQGTSERAQLAVKRTQEHQARRGVKTKGMSEEIVDEGKKMVKVKLNPEKKIGVKVTDIGPGGKEVVRKNTMDEGVKGADPEMRKMAAQDRMSGKEKRLSKKVGDRNVANMTRKIEQGRERGMAKAYEEVELTEVKDKKAKGSGTKDACYHKVKSRYSVWPSAYASGALVKCRKVGAANWGNSKKESFSDWRSEFIWEDGDSEKKLTEDDMKGMSVKSGHKRPTKSGAGMTQKGVEAYRRRNPGSKLKTAVTTEPSKLKKGSKAANRRKSYCARSAGQMKKFPKAAKDPNSRLRQARRRWNC